MGKPVLSSLRSRLMAIAVLPPVIAVLMLVGYLIYARSADYLSALDIRGAATARFLAGDVRLLLFSGDLEALARRAEDSISVDSADAIVFFDADKSFLQIRVDELVEGVISKESSLTILNRCMTVGQWFNARAHWFCRVVTSREIDVDDLGLSFDSEVNPAPEVLGYVLVGRSLEPYQSQLTTYWLAGGAVAAMVLLLSGGLAMYLGRSIGKPLAALVRLVQRKSPSTDLSLNIEVDIEEVRVLRDSILGMMHENVRIQTYLEQRVAEATRQMLLANNDLSDRNKELLAVQDELNEAARSREAFIARISHEYRTPLTTVIGYGKLLQNEVTYKGHRDYASHIIDSSQNLLGIIDDILVFSSMGSVGIQLHEEAFDLQHLLHSVSSTHAYAAARKGLELVLTLESGLPRQVVGDSARLRQVLTNLLGNAIKFTDEGEVVLIVGIDEENTLQLRIHDSGIGVDAQRIPLLFTPFMQADESINRRFGGSGLGLSISRQLVVAMGGRIEFESVLGEGSDVSVFLPIQIESLAQAVSVAAGAVVVCDANSWSRRALRLALAQVSRDVFALSSTDALMQRLEAGALPDALVIGYGPGAQLFEIIEADLQRLRDIYLGPVLVLAPVATLSVAQINRLVNDYQSVKVENKPIDVDSLADWLSDGTVPEPSPVLARKPLSDLCLTGLRVLLVEDNDYNRVLIGILLRRHGARVVLAEDGAKALERFAAGAIDVVILDVHMPGLTGIDVARLLREEDEVADLPIIALTADTTQAQREALHAVGVVDVLYKPLDETALLAILSNIAGKSDVVAASAEAEAEGGMLRGTVAAGQLAQEVAQQLSVLDSQVAEALWQDVTDTIHQLKGLTGLGGFAEWRDLIASMSAASKACDNKALALYIKQLRAKIAQTQ